MCVCFNDYFVCFICFFVEGEGSINCSSDCGFCALNSEMLSLDKN